MVFIPAIDGLLEQRNAGFLPQLMTEQQRRVGRQGQGDGGDQLHGIEAVGKVLRVQPPVQLERGIGPLQGDIIPGQIERWRAINVYFERGAPQAPQGIIHGPIAGLIRHHVGAELA